MHDAPVGRNLPGRYANRGAPPKRRSQLLSLRPSAFCQRITSCNSPTTSISLLDDFDLEGHGNRAVKLQRDLGRAQSLDRLGQLDLLTIERDSGLLEGLGDVLARDRAVHLAFVT